jgi:hypothetical protein
MDMTGKRRRALSLTLALALPVGAGAQTATLTGTVVRDSAGHEVREAQITLPELNRSATTNYRGEFRFDRLPPGRYVVVVRHIGFKPLIDTVALTNGANVDRELILTEAAVTLDSVRVTAPEKKYLSPGLQAFEERRRLGAGGHFITEDELRKSDSRTMTNVIRPLPGLRIICAKAITPQHRPGECWAVSGRSNGRLAILGGDCPVDIYLNGIIVNDNDLEKFSVAEFAGIEYYAGGASIPIQYNRTGANCGVMLFWTRER